VNALGQGFLSLPTLGASVLRCKGEELWRPCSPALLFASPPASTWTLSRPQLAGTALTSTEKEFSRILAFLSVNLRLRMCFEYCVPSFRPHLRSIVGGFLFISWTQLAFTALT
jgi:hypothetical protein